MTTYSSHRRQTLSHARSDTHQTLHRPHAASSQISSISILGVRRITEGANLTCPATSPPVPQPPPTQPTLARTPLHKHCLFHSIVCFYQTTVSRRKTPFQASCHLTISPSLPTCNVTVSLIIPSRQAAKLKLNAPGPSLHSTPS